MLELKIMGYCESFREKWDDFVMNHSVNGTFLQTRRFLEYHRNRFEDVSLVIYKGNDTVVAVIPACAICDEGKKNSAHIAAVRLAVLSCRIYFMTLSMSMR